MAKKVPKNSRHRRTLRVLIVDTAYWQIVVRIAMGLPNGRENGAHDPGFLREMSATSSYALARSLEANGYQVRVLIANQPPNGTSKSQSLTWWERLSKSQMFFRWWQAISRLPAVGDLLHSNFAISRVVRGVLAREDFDIAYILNPNFMTPRLMKAASKRIPVLIGQIASPLPPKRYFERYTHMVSAHPGQVDAFRALGLRSSYIPLAVDQGILPKTFLPNAQRDIDVSFVGSFGRHHKEGTQLIREVARAIPTLKIFSLSPVSKLRRLGLLKHFAGSVWGQEMINVYSRSKIVINRHGEVAEGFAVNFRMYEAAGAGAVVMTEEAPNLPDLFEVGVEVESYTSSTELISKVRDYLSDADKCEQVGLAAFKAVRERHLSAQRYKDISEIIESEFQKNTVGS
jgi:spore maturation protein CgeB